MTSYPFAVLVALLLGATPAAQISTESTYTIKGSVVESTTGQPIAGATVTSMEVVTKAGIVQYQNPDSTPSTTTKTGAEGSFRMTVSHPGRYRVGVKMENYTDFSHVVEVRTGETTTSIEVRLERHAVLVGRLFDDKLKKPVAGVNVTAARAAFYKGRRVLGPVLGVSTDQLGNFRIAGLRPRDYFIEISPPVQETIVVDRKEPLQTEEDREKVYRRFLYPEGPLETSFPIKLYPGAELNIGDVPITKQPLYEIRARLLPGGCSESETVNVSLNERYGAMKRSGPSGKLACGSRFIVTNLPPGTYSLRAWVPGKPLKERPSAFSEIVIRDRDVDVILELRQPTIIQGRLRLANDSSPLASPLETSGTKELFGSLRIGIHPVGTLPFADEVQPISPSSDGGFAAPALPAADLQLSVLGIQPPHYAKEVLYNGTRIEGTIFRLNNQAVEQSLVIVLADDSATVNGTVEDDSNRAIADATVVMLPWPLKYEDGFPIFTSASSDASGKFELKAVAPGSYRLVSFLPSAKEEIHVPNTLAALAGDGMQLDVKPRELRSVVLKSGH